MDKKVKKATCKDVVIALSLFVLGVLSIDVVAKDFSKVFLCGVILLLVIGTTLLFVYFWAQKKCNAQSKEQKARKNQPDQLMMMQLILFVLTS